MPYDADGKYYKSPPLPKILVVERDTSVVAVENMINSFVAGFQAVAVNRYADAIKELNNNADDYVAVLIDVDQNFVVDGENKVIKRAGFGAADFLEGFNDRAKKPLPYAFIGGQTRIEQASTVRPNVYCIRNDNVERLKEGISNQKFTRQLSLSKA